MMNRKTLIAAVGAGGVLTMLVVASLVVPGPDCPPVLVECTGRFGSTARGLLSLSGGKYQTFLARAFECPDGGIILPTLPEGAEIFNPDLCSVVTRTCVGPLCVDPVVDGGHDMVTQTPHKCFCWQEDAGACRKVSDNSRPPEGKNVLRGEWAGAGCVRVPCGELYGEPSWPEGCN